MKSACALLSLMLASVAIPLSAQTTVNLTGGNVTQISPDGFQSYPTGSFTAPGYTITNVVGADPVGVGTPVKKAKPAARPAKSSPSWR